jgi:lipoprotein signal peptidase
MITIAITVVFLYFILQFLVNWKWWFFLGAGLFLSGAWGNVIDRLRLGFVIDFFEPSIWATFNVADITIIVGLVFIFIQIWIQVQLLKKQKIKVYDSEFCRIDIWLHRNFPDFSVQPLQGSSSKVLSKRIK